MMVSFGGLRMTGIISPIGSNIQGWWVQCWSMLERLDTGSVQTSSDWGWLFQKGKKSHRRIFCHAWLGKLQYLVFQEASIRTGWKQVLHFLYVRWGLFQAPRTEEKSCKMRPPWRGDLGDLVCWMVSDVFLRLQTQGSDSSLLCCGSTRGSWPWGCSQAAQNLSVMPCTCVRTCYS